MTTVDVELSDAEIEVLDSLVSNGVAPTREEVLVIALNHYFEKNSVDI